MDTINPKIPLLEHELRQDLGKRVDYFPIRYRTIKRWAVLTLSALMVLASSILSVAFFIATHQAIHIHGRAVFLNRLPQALVLTGIPLGILLGVLTNTHWHNGITHFDHGLVQHKGKRDQIWLWKDVDQLDTRITLVKFSTSTIALRIRIFLEDLQKRHWTIRNNYARIDELTSQIRSNILPILYEKSRRRLLQDEVIVFHKDLQAIRNGLEINQALTPWLELEKPVIDHGKFVLHRKPKKETLFKSDLNKIRNLDLLIQLIENPPVNSD